MLIDLHVHTTASDGQYDSSEIIRLAVEKGIKILAITDHDTVKGAETARRCLKDGDGEFRFISGIEISTQDTEEIHILGYGLDLNDALLLQACEEFQQARVGRGERIVSFLRGKGIDVDLEEVKAYAKDGILGRPHFARYLLEHRYVTSRKEAFDRYLDTPAFREATERKKPPCKEAIELIHTAGGKAVLAHPGLYRMSEDKLEQLVGELADAGLDGIECFYCKHSRSQTVRYLEWMRRFGLKTSCGSDFHGESVKPENKLGMEFDMQRYGGDLITTLL